MRNRLPRRYDAVVKTLKQLMETGNARVKESAAMRLSDIYLEWDRSCERREIAAARAESRLEIAALEKTARDTPETVQVDSEAEAVAKIESDTKASVDEYLSRFTKTA